MNGRRVYPNAEGWLPNLEPGDYGKCTAPEATGRNSWWQCRAPDGSSGCFDPSIHSITEHEDGTITVHPSIDFSKRKAGAYHGYLRAGEWSDPP